MARSGGWKSAWRSRPPEPAAARRAARRHEPARAGRDRQAAQVDQPRPHHDHHRPRHGRALRAGRARSPCCRKAACWSKARRRRSRATPRCRKPISAECTVRMSLLEVNGLNSYYGDSHILFDVALRVEQHEVVALLGRNGAGKSTTLEEPDGRGDAARRLDRFDGADIAGQKATPSRGPACSSCRGPPHLRQPQCRGEPRPGGSDGAERAGRSSASTRCSRG